MAHSSNPIDVAIIGGGPAGSTAGALLKKYAPALRVVVLERESFPRDHVGESQLPGISRVLAEMGCWDKVEAANFPIKVGATYLWGRSPELWDFDFMPTSQIPDCPRPGRFEGHRARLAFQVDRACYDDILLKHAASLGCEVRERTAVTRVLTQGDRIEGLELQSGERIVARHYLDASGHVGLIRRSLGVQVERPTSLQNIAFWDYWRNASWPEEIGVGGTRVQVISVGFGWIWFIPLGPDRTSVGLVVPKEYFKACRKTSEELYAAALEGQPRIASLMTGAVSEGKFQATKDWSFVAERLYGENWLLVGESAGFADPILAAGMTITHAAAREAAFTLLEIDRGGDEAWLKQQYGQRQAATLRTHIRFADYWYTANAQFADLQEHVGQIARDNGLDLAPERAWAWLAQGGFIDSEDGVSLATFSPEAMIAVGQKLSNLPSRRLIESNNVFRLKLDGAAKRLRATYRLGRVHPLRVFERDGKVWPLNYPFDKIFSALQASDRLADLLTQFQQAVQAFPPEQRGLEGFRIMLSFETLVRDGWIEADYDPAAKLMKPYQVNEMIHWHEPEPAHA